MQNKSSKRRFSRKLSAEQLENRALMAGDLIHNFLEPNDVNDDRRVTATDALQVISGLNRRRGGSTDDTNSPRSFRDVNDDSRLSPTDALIVINALNSRSDNTGDVVQLTKTEARVNSASRTTAQLEYEVIAAQKELSVKVRDAAPNQKYPVLINDLALGDLVTDAKGRGRIVLSEGDDNSTHLPLPANLPGFSADTELVIGDILRGKLTNVSVSTKYAPAPAGGSNTSNGSNWVANFEPVGQLQRKAEFETEVEDGSTKSKFKIQIEGSQPNQSYSVQVGSFSLGDVTVDARGRAKVTWSSTPKQGELTLPSGFPEIGGTTILTIGLATATFKAI